MGSTSNCAFWLLVAIHLAASGLGVMTLISARIKAAFFRMPVLVQKSGPVACVGPLFLLPLVPQSRLDFIPAVVGAVVGFGALAASGVLWLLAFRAIGFIPSIRPAKGLVATGPYAVIRNPIYLGILLSTLGLAVAFRAKGALLYWPAVVAVFVSGILVEERSLRAEYGAEYAAYVKQVPYRLLPWLF